MSKTPANPEAVEKVQLTDDDLDQAAGAGGTYLQYKLKDVILPSYPTASGEMDPTFKNGSNINNGDGNDVMGSDSGAKVQRKRPG